MITADDMEPPVAPSLAMDKICRSCMLQKEGMKSLLEHASLLASSSTICPETGASVVDNILTGKQQDQLPLADMLMACTSVHINIEEGLPMLLCAECEARLNTAYDFKRQCEFSEIKLRELTNQQLGEKVEVKPDMTLLNTRDESLDDVQDDPDFVDDFDKDDDDVDEDDDGGGEAVRIELQDDAEEEDDEEDDDPSYDSDYGNDHSPRTRRRDGLKFSCTTCPKSFVSRRSLRSHLISHRPKKQKTCTVCYQKFDDDKFLAHVQTHKDVLQHVCSICGMAFTRAYHLVKHKKDHKAEVISIMGEGDERMDCDEDWKESEALMDDEHTLKTISSNGDRSFQCKYCFKVLSTYAGMRIHLKKHIPSNQFACRLCSRSFDKGAKLAKHLKAVHDVDAKQEKLLTGSKGKQVMECEFCDRKFKYKKSFDQHMTSEHGFDVDEDEDTPLSQLVIKRDNALKIEQTGLGDDHVIGTEALLECVVEDPPASVGVPGKAFTCHVCQAKFGRANHLTRHMTLHRAVLVHKCTSCETSFATPEHLAKHMDEEHVRKPYTCNVCSRNFDRGEHLIRHLKQHEVIVNERFKCSLCPKEFSKSELLAMHIKVHLSQDKRHVCPDCGKAFNRLDNLKTHQKLHTGQKDNSKLHLCIYCGKEFNNSSNMIVHMRRHTGERPYKCATCGKGFPRSHDLKCHERTHSGEKPYLCTLCGKSFNKSNKLLRHSRVHTGERPYVCNICGRAFTQSNDLSLHMRRHTGSRPYACGMCPARFIQSGQLKAHRRSTGHWMETQPDLKGGHRVEPVVVTTEPAPIRFKTHGKKKPDEDISVPMDEHLELANANNAEVLMQQQQILSNVNAVSIGDDNDSNAVVAGIGSVPVCIESQPPRILKQTVGIMGANSLLDNGKLMDQFSGYPLVVNANLAAEANRIKSEVDANGLVFSTFGNTSTTSTFSNSEAFQFHHHPSYQHPS